MLLRTSKHTLSPSMLTCYPAAGAGDWGQSAGPHVCEDGRVAFVGSALS